jgi:hypothetical protein
LRSRDSCWAVASAITTARSGNPRSRATWAIVRAFATCSAVTVNGDPVIVQSPATGGLPVFWLSQATPTRTAAATTSAGHQRETSHRFFRRVRFFLLPATAGRRRWDGRRRVVLLLVPAG